MVKIFKLDRMVNTTYKNSAGLFLSSYIYQANRHFVEFPESMHKQLSRKRVQHADTPERQHSGIWHKEDKHGE